MTPLNIQIDEPGDKVVIGPFSIVRIHELRRRVNIDANEKITIEDKVIDVDEQGPPMQSVTALTIPRWGPWLKLAGGWRSDHCPVRSGVAAQIYLDDEDIGGVDSYTYLRCFDNTGTIPVSGTPYKLDTAPEQPAGFDDWSAADQEAWEDANMNTYYEAVVCQMEDNRLCVFFVDFPGGVHTGGVQIINIDPNSLNVLSVGSWIPLVTPAMGYAFYLRIKCIRDNQVVASWTDGVASPDEIKAIAITWAGDAIASQSAVETLAITNPAQDRYDLATKRDGTFLYLVRDQGDASNSFESGKYTVAVDNTFTFNYKVNGTGEDVYSKFVSLEYDSTNNWYVASTLKRPSSFRQRCWTVTDSGSALTFDTQDEWTRLWLYGAVGVLEDGTALGFGWDRDDDYVKSDWISYAAAVPVYEGDPFLHYLADGAGQYYLQDLDFIDIPGGRPMFIMGLGDNICSRDDANWSRLWISS